MNAQTTLKTTGALSTLPLIALDGAVVFPHTVATLPLDGDTALAAEASLGEGRLVLLVARRGDAPDDAPLALQLHRVGVVARIEQAGALPNGATGIAVRGLVRAVLGEQTQIAPYPRFAFTEQPDRVERTSELDALMTETHAAIDVVLNARHGVTHEIGNIVLSINDVG